LFFGAADVRVYKLLEELKVYIQSFGKDLIINPRYMSYKHPYFNETDPTFIDSNLEDCLCGGRYCVDSRGSIKGREILFEGIRQKCIHDFSYTIKSNNTIYTKYLEYFYEACIDKEQVDIENLDKGFNSACSEEVAKHLEVPENYLERCIDQSFNPAGIGYSLGELTINSFLENSKIKKKTYDNLSNSGILINKRLFFNFNNIQSLKKGLCESTNSKPEICFKEGISEEGFSITTLIIWLVVVLVAANIAIIYFCRRYISKKVQKRVQDKEFVGEINETVSKYNKLGAENTIN